MVDINPSMNQQPLKDVNCRWTLERRNENHGLKCLYSVA